MRGAAAHYGKQAEVEHDPCTLDGADSCVFRCRFHTFSGTVSAAAEG